MVIEALMAKGCLPSHENLVQVVYKLCRVRPEPYSLKLRLAFAPETHARTVVLEIFNSLLSIVRWNEEGIIKDIDTEFLHDFRVSLRKLRSVTGQVKSVFPESLTTIWKNKVCEICRRTNALRDYDVYILSRQRLEGMLPRELRAGLEPFFERLKTKRHIEARKVADFLRSDTYKNQVSSLQAAWGSAISIEPAANSERPIREVAAERILKRFRRIRKASKGINTETPDAVIHSVRIDCKKCAISWSASGIFSLQSRSTHSPANWQNCKMCSVASTTPLSSRNIFYSKPRDILNRERHGLRSRLAGSSAACTTSTQLFATKSLQDFTALPEAQTPAAPPRSQTLGKIDLEPHRA